MSTTAPIERKLTTLLSADVAGYSAMMERDEVATLHMLRRCREAMDGLITRHRGRVVNTAGDGMLAEFGSVVEAVQCGVEIQKELAGHDHDRVPDDRMRLRIGINLGDVMVYGDDLFGEGVNVAARLQALADPGGIMISGSAYDQVRHKLSVGFDFLGMQPVKNLAEDVPVYRVLLDPQERARGRRNGDWRAEGGRSGDSSAADKSGPFAPRPAVPPWLNRLRRDLAIAGLGAILSLSPTLHWLIYPTLVFLVIALSRHIHDGVREKRSRTAFQLLLIAGFLVAINLVSDPSPLWSVFPGVVLLLVAYWTDPSILTRIKRRADSIARGDGDHAGR